MLQSQGDRAPLSMNPPRPKVYVIDDDAAVRRALGRLLQSAGYDVEVLAGSEDYLAREAPSSPACLVVDLRMPGMNGLELLRTIAGTPRGIPVVLMSGHSDEVARLAAMAQGAVDVLSKPLDGAVLLAAVGRALQRSTPLATSPTP